MVLKEMDYSINYNLIGKKKKDLNLKAAVGKCQWRKQSAIFFLLEILTVEMLDMGIWKLFMIVEYLEYKLVVGTLLVLSIVCLNL